MLAELISEQAEQYFFARVVLFSGVADHSAVTVEKAVDGAIAQLFDSEFFSQKQLHKLFRRLHAELKLQVSISNREMHRLVKESLVELTTTRIEKRAGSPYAEIIGRREELARELTVHPDLALALA